MCPVSTHWVHQMSCVPWVSTHQISCVSWCMHVRDNVLCTLPGYPSIGYPVCPGGFCIRLCMLEKMSHVSNIHTHNVLCTLPGYPPIGYPVCPDVGWQIRVDSGQQLTTRPATGKWLGQRQFKIYMLRQSWTATAVW